MLNCCLLNTVGFQKLQRLFCKLLTVLPNPQTLSAKHLENKKKKNQTPAKTKQKANQINKTTNKQRSNLSVFLFGFFFNIISSLIFPGVRLAADSQFSDFLDGLGPGQLVGRQTLATPSMGKCLRPLDMIYSIWSGN